MRDDPHATGSRAARDAASLSNPIIAEADAIRIALRWFPWYTQQATEMDRAAYDCLSETLIANGWLPPSKYQTETVKR